MSSDRIISIQVPRFAVWVLTFLMLAPWAFVVWWISPRGDQASAHGQNRPPATVTPNFSPAGIERTSSNPGPWGNLTYSRILLEPPEEFILSDYTQTAIQPWVFKGYSEVELDALWQSAGLNPAQRKYVADPRLRTPGAGAIVLHPDRDFIIGLTPIARARIYGALSEFPENVPQFNPFRLRANIATDWLEGTDVPPEAIALTKKLMYERGTALCFSDESLVLPTIPSAAQRVHYIKALARKLALLVELNIRPGQNVDELAAYWGRGGRTKDLKPLLQSIARRPNGGSIDIVHLIPRFARLLVYTYPFPSERPIDANHDCHWTSFNFQNDEPDERFSNIDYVRQVLLGQYYPVLGAPLLGDIVMFVRQDGVVVHSCVYIADDIVFTKNGPAYSVPWTFSPLADVQAYYADRPGIEMRRYRAKNL